MTKPRNIDSDIFTRRPVVDLRARLNRLAVLAEADIAGYETFMEATIAAAMIIAHADGEADLTERRRVISLFRTNPMLQGFSADDIAREVVVHTQAFQLDHASADRRARSQILTADLSDDQFRALLGVCVSVLEADGVRHPAEEDALANISTMRPWGYR
ncbi:TerB family tellurite resistance protein [Roseovarius sp.]|uniref:TerB family tellurite resistance protein n=1 Tax=Roseovarius sp. TaxID=1486281 RepID=UPI003A97F2E8